MMRETATGPETMSLNTEEWLKGKLADPWGGENISGQIKDVQLREIASQFSTYDTDIKSKILIAVLNMKKRRLMELQKDLEAVMQAAETDTDEWVRVLRWLMQGYITKRTLAIHLSACDNKLGDAYKAMCQKLEDGPPKFAPFEHIYLNKSIMEEPYNPLSQHFKVKNPPVRPDQLKTKLQEIAAMADDVPTPPPTGGTLARRGSHGIKPLQPELTRPGTALDRRPSSLPRSSLGINRHPSLGAGGGGKKYLQSKKHVVVLNQEESITLAKTTEKRKKTEDELMQEELERQKKREDKKKKEADEK
eukprot:Ihof_evm1s1125 gene=Ihof_evmTU1s1125